MAAKKQRDLALLALESLAAYKASGLVAPGDSMFGDIALRMALTLNKEER